MAMWLVQLPIARFKVDESDAGRNGIVRPVQMHIEGDSYMRYKERGSFCYGFIRLYCSRHT